MSRYALDAVGIHGFRGLRHLKLDGLGRVNLLVGGNNSGKTSVLEALSVLCDPLNPNEWMRVVGRRDFGRLNESRLLGLRWCFTQSSPAASQDELGPEALCSLLAEGSFPLRRVDAKYQEQMREPTERTMRRRRIYGAVDENQLERGCEITHSVVAERDTHLFANPEVRTIDFWEDTFVPSRTLTRRLGLRLPAETLTPVSYQLNTHQVTRHTEAELRGEREIIDLVREFDPNVERVLVGSQQGRRPAIFLRHAQLGPAPLSVFGDAVRRVVLLAATAVALRGGVLMLDEIETGIHVSHLRRLFGWLTDIARTADLQIFATTHSLEAVDAFLPGTDAHPEELVAFHLDQTPEQTRVRRFDHDLLSRLRREYGLDVR